MHKLGDGNSCCGIANIYQLVSLHEKSNRLVFIEDADASVFLDSPQTHENIADNNNNNNNINNKQLVHVERVGDQSILRAYPKNLMAILVGKQQQNATVLFPV